MIPYLGPGVLALASRRKPAFLLLPKSWSRTSDLDGATVPHKIRNNLTAAAQYIENFKHRKTIVAAMGKAFDRIRPSRASCTMARASGRNLAAGRQRLV